MTEGDGEAQRERTMGAHLAAARAAAGLTIRRAASQARVPAVLWADMERGERGTPGVPVRADDATIAAAARVVGLDAAVLFAALGRPTPPDLAVVPPPTAAGATDVEDRLRRLEAAVTLLAARAGLTPEELDLG